MTDTETFDIKRLIPITSERFEKKVAPQDLAYCFSLCRVLTGHNNRAALPFFDWSLLLRFLVLTVLYCTVYTVHVLQESNGKDKRLNSS